MYYSVLSDEKPLHFGAIVCLLGARYKSYCSNIGRTLLVNPTDKMQVLEKLLSKLEVKVGINVCLLNRKSTTSFYQWKMKF